MLNPKQSIFICEGKSFMYNKNNNGPKVDPCGTPTVMIKVSDSQVY